MSSQDLILSIKSGNPNNFPFDVYESKFYIQGLTSERTKKPVSLSLSLVNSLNNWKTDIELLANDNADFSVLIVDLKLSRAPTQKFFSLFIAILMWAMSLGIFLMAIAHVWHNRKVEASTIVSIINKGVVSTMLFALPAVRNMQPGAPPIGCTTDSKQS